jgi:apolipoprotein N-acyltransferase
VTPFVALVPFALFVDGLEPGAEGRRAAVRGSLLFGLVYFGLLLYWILVALIWFTKLAILAYVATILALMGFSALFGWMLHRGVHHLRVPLWLALPVTWTSIEWLRAHLPGSLAFPWLGLGTSLTGYPELVGIAEIVGARGVTFWLALANGVLAVIVLRLRARRPWLGVAGALTLVLALPMGWGVWRAHTLTMRPAAKVAVVQPDIREDLKLDVAASLDSTGAALHRLLPPLAADSLNLVVLPEVALQVAPRVRSTTADGAMIVLNRYSRELGAPILFGAIGVSADGHGGYIPYNSAFLMRPRELSDWEYDKHYLVPMVERVPLVPVRWLRGLEYFGTFGVGKGWPLAYVDGTAYGVLICYESSYPQGSRHFRLEGADVLLNITNDAWYGRRPWYARTTALWQHPAHMVMRAIENRVGVARAANTGISMFIDPIGHVHEATPLFREATRVDTVYTTDVRTLYTRFGDVVGDGSALAALLLALTSLWISRRARTLDPSGEDD